MLRSTIVLIVLAALCHGLTVNKKLPVSHAAKAHHVDLPKHHVETLEESMEEPVPALEEEEEVSAAEPQEQLEENEEDENTQLPALEEKDENEEEDGEVVAEKDDEDDSKVLEEEEEHAIAAKKVKKDVDRMLEALEGSDLPEKTISAAKENLNVISKDSHEIISASKSRAANLKKAIKLRMEALKLMLNGDHHEQAALEEEEEEAPKVRKVVDDVSGLKKALEENDYSEELKEQARSNLDSIAADAKEIPTASQSRAKDLKKAIGFRMKALKLMLGKPEAKVAKPLELEEEKEQKLNKVEGDIRSLESEVSTSSLPAAAKKQARKNLEEIKKDAEAIASSTNSHAKSLFKEAIQKRMAALHEMLDSADHKEASSVDAKKVLDDVHHLQTALKSASLPKNIKKEARKNLSTILKDAEELSTAAPARRQKLTKAMKLRAKALRMQLEEN